MLQDALTVQRKWQTHERSQRHIRDVYRAALFESLAEELLPRVCAGVREQVEEHEAAARAEDAERFAHGFGFVLELAHFVEGETTHDAVELG